MDDDQTDPGPIGTCPECRVRVPMGCWICSKCFPVEHKANCDCCNPVPPFEGREADEQRYMGRSVTIPDGEWRHP